MTMQRNSMAGTIAAVVIATALSAPSPARAHFVLKAPASWMSQDALGSPQKLGPCGDEAGGTATGAITSFKPGQTIAVTIDEKVYHPGHYRIALSVHDRSELPPEPPVTAASTPCGSVPIESPAVFPVLADGVLVHTAPFSAPQTVQVTLPSNVTCTKCTLQVIEFMSDHPLNNPGGCFYHHCADIAIDPDAGAAPDAALADDGGSSVDGSSSEDAGVSSAAPMSSSGCSVGGGGGALGVVGAALFAMTALVRRRRARAPG